MASKALVARTAFTLALALGPSGCASSHRAVVFPSLPEGAVDPSWARPLVARAANELFADLMNRGPLALIDRRIHGDDVAAYYTESGQSRIGRVMAGLTPHASERRWTALRGFVGSTVAGWCARGVRVAEANGAEGFRGRVLTVDRLLLVGRQPDGLWAMWLEGLVYTSEGWRFAPTVPYGEAVQAPRRDHADAELWDCDLGSRPEGVSSAPPPAG